MKLNKKGYMLVEIIVAAVIAFSIAYYLLNLTFKFKDQNELVHDSRDLNSIKINVTKNIMNDINGKELSFKIKDNGEMDETGVEKINDKDYYYFIFYVGEEQNPRKLAISNNEIKYGRYFNNEIVQANSSYYTKTINSSYLQFDVDNNKNPISVTKEDDNILVSIDIPVASIYTDEVVHIKLLLQGHKYEEVDYGYLLNGESIPGSFEDILNSAGNGDTFSANNSILLPDKNNVNELTIDINDKNVILESPLLVKEGTTITITGSGTLTSGFNNYLIENQGTLILNGVSLVNNSGGLINNSNGEKLEIKDGTNITSKVTSGAVVNGGNIVMSGGIVNAYKSKGIYTDGVLTITGGTINKTLDTAGTGNGAAVHYAGIGTAEVQNVTINVTNADSNNIWNGSTGTINLRNVIASNSYHRCVTNSSKGVINTYGTKYTCQKYAFVNKSSGIINIYSGNITTAGSTSSNKIFLNEISSGKINDNR